MLKHRLKQYCLTSMVLTLLTCSGLGCASGHGRYLQETDPNEPRVFRNRIHNPRDCRYRHRCRCGDVCERKHRGAHRRSAGGES